MGFPHQRRTERLLLRRWADTDLAPFAALNADPAVMEHFPGPLSRDESDALARRLDRSFDDLGFGAWAVEVAATGEFVGFVGLAPVPADAPFAPAVEIGWRLARTAWGSGYATEAARAALDAGFRELGLAEIVAFTTVGNVRSRAVMERLRMERDPGDDFDHWRLPAGHPLRRHVLYRASAPPPGGAGVTGRR